MVSRAPDITERTIIDLSGRTATYYDPTGNKFDVAIAGMPFIMAVTDNTPYKRQTAEFRAQRVDQMRDPGEHTLAGSGYWARSQSSFHYGAGIQFAEPLEGNDNEVRFRFRDSVGINPWVPGQISLLNSTSLVQAFRGKTLLASGNNSGANVLLATDAEPVVSTTTTTSAASGSTTISVASTAGVTVGWHVSNGSNIQSGTVVSSIGAGTVTLSKAVSSGTMASTTTVRFMPVNAVYKINTSNTSTPFVTFESLGSKTILAQTSDGGTLYVATADNIYDINLTTGAVHDSYTINTTSAANVVLKYVKSRVIAGITRTDGTMAAYELTFPNKGSGASINISTLTAINGSNNMPVGWVWNTCTEASGAIYLGGYSGEHSAVYKLSVDNTGALGTITSTATLPRGEVVSSLYGYLGTYVLVGTNKGVRITTADTNGDLTYGPLSYETTNENPVYDFEGRDAYIWFGATNNVGEHSGTYRLNLGQPLTLSGYAQPIATGLYAKASDVYADETYGTVRNVRIFDTTNRVAFSVDGSGVWIQNATELVPTGQIRTGRIRYDTLENKAWKRLRVRTPNFLYGAIDMFKVGESVDTAINTIYEGINNDYDYDLAAAYPDVSVDASFKFALNRNSTDATTGAVIYGMSVKALPTPTRARIIQIPLFCYDKETDKLGNILGYEGYGRERLAMLESIEAQGKTVIIQDFNAGGEPTEAIIEQVSFTRSTPSNRNYTGFGGIISVTARTVA